MLRENVCIAEVMLKIRPEDFYLAAHQKIFRAIVAMFDASRGVDLVTLHAELQWRGELEDTGDAPYLAQLWDAAPTAANVRYYAELVRDRSLLRNLIHAGTEILSDAYSPAGPAEDVLEEAERRILAVSELGASRRNPNTWQRSLGDIPAHRWPDESK
jgi:replicative DNA helicase